MIKILILCNNLETAKQITNKVTSNLESTRIIGISSKLTEFKSIINNSEPDLIITKNKNIINKITIKKVKLDAKYNKTLMPKIPI